MRKYLLEMDFPVPVNGADYPQTGYVLYGDKVGKGNGKDHLP